MVRAAHAEHVEVVVDVEVAEAAAVVEDVASRRKANYFEIVQNLRLFCALWLDNAQLPNCLAIPYFQ